jgi:hypothetical protein
VVPSVVCVATSTGAWRTAQNELNARMLGWFGSTGGLPDLALRRVACAHALLVRLAVTDELAYVTLAVIARLPAVIAEAAHARAGDFRDYPSRLPDYRYIDDDGVAP